MREGVRPCSWEDTPVTFLIVVLLLATGPLLIWFAVSRGDVLRAGYVPMTAKPSLQAGLVPQRSRPVRHEGVIHLVMVDHVDPGLVLVILRIEGGPQWISTVRTDQHGCGIGRLDSWRENGRRVVVTERPRAREVLFRPLSVRAAHSDSLASRPLTARWDRPLGQIGT